MTKNKLEAMCKDIYLKFFGLFVYKYVLNIPLSPTIRNMHPSYQKELPEEQEAETISH